MEQNYTSLIEVFKKITTTTHEQFGKIYKENIFTDPTANLIVDGLVVQSKFIRNIVINGCGGTGATGLCPGCGHAGYGLHHRTCAETVPLYRCGCVQL